MYNIPYFFEEPVTFTSNSTTIPGWKYDSQFFFASDNVVGDPYYLRISNSHRVNEWISVSTYSFWGIRQ
ncbi:MAG: hypothetical protein DCO96_14670 [Fluviicola sp. XM-24bin1]|nr:MAG: hypothetical protein DCO96_14670 [Fluviicola sp. XM-24bin1]